MTTSSENPYLNDDFAKDLIEIGDREADSKCLLYYDRDGDFIEFLAERDSYDAERVSPLLTVYYSTNTGKMIGSKIKGVKSLLSRYPLLSVIVKDRKVRFDYLIVGELFETTPDSRALQYQFEKIYRSLMDLIENIEDPSVEAPELVSPCG